MKLSIQALLWVVLLSQLLASGALWAHGPTRQKITETVEVVASPQEVWNFIGNFQDMSWHPAVFSTKGTDDNNIDATRVLTLRNAQNEKSDATISEVLYKYNAEQMSYSYRITEVKVEVLPVTNYSSHLSVKPAANGKTLIEWKGAFYRGYPNNDPPPELSDEAAIAAVSGVYRAGLDALAKHFSNPL